MTAPALLHHVFVEALVGPPRAASEIASRLQVCGIVESPPHATAAIGYLPLGRLLDASMREAFRENVWGGYGAMGLEPEPGYDEVSAVLVVPAPEQPLELFEGAPDGPARRCPACGRVKTFLPLADPLHGAPLRAADPRCLFCGRAYDPASWAAADPEPAFRPRVDLQLYLGELRYYLEPFGLLDALSPSARAQLEECLGGVLLEHTEVL